jgi:hypothetical protein
LVFNLIGVPEKQFDNNRLMPVVFLVIFDIQYGSF